MRVIFTPGEARWPSYTSLFEFRRTLADQIGVRLEDMEGFGGTKPWSLVVDPIAPLLMLEDVSGSISVALCPQVADRLESLVREWNADNPDRERALELVVALRLAHRLRQRLRMSNSAD